MAPTAIVCEDNVGVRRVISGVLEAAGYAVVAEVDMVVSLLPAVVAAQPKLVVLDLLLEGVSGLDAVADLQTAAPGVRIVVFSGHDAWRQAALAEGVTAWVDKPDFGALEAVVRRFAD
jgi:CheY-like chemotaxis protein